MNPIPTFALITPSYRGDFERCRLLCASIDHFVTGMTTHYLLVDNRDVALFKSLESPKRRVIAEGELLPAWLPSWPDPLSGGKRRVWLGPGSLARGIAPLRGWHVQQLLKLAVPRLIADDVLLYADSDVIFLKPFDVATQIAGDKVRLFRKPDSVRTDMANHVLWSSRAAKALGLPVPNLPAADYVNNLVTWTSPNARSLIDHIERVNGCHWIAAVTKGRGFSEWMIYGQFVHDVLGERSGHFPSADELVKTYWFSNDVTADTLSPASLSMNANEVALGVQSFINVPPEQLWDVFRRFAVRR